VTGVQCPKEKQISLIEQVLNSDLSAYGCPGCQGNWIPGSAYTSWQVKQSVPESEAAVIDRLLGGFCESPPLDGKASLCPECQAYLARAKVPLKLPFYVERCPSCKGIWCDRGEWEFLTEMGMGALLPRLFAQDWQALTRTREHIAQERRATIEKLGPDLAARVFELAELLENHPYGDFGVAYQMRRFNQ
jgi:Zn-finger nucleic acid-binding protein